MNVNYKLSCYFPMLLYERNTDIHGSFRYLRFFFSWNHLCSFLRVLKACFFFRWKWLLGASALMGGSSIKKNYGMGRMPPMAPNCIKATQQLRGDSLLFTTQFPGNLGTHLMNPRRMKDWVELRVTQQFELESPGLGIAHHCSIK